MTLIINFNYVIDESFTWIWKSISSGSPPPPCRWVLNCSFKSLDTPTSWNILWSLLVYSKPRIKKITLIISQYRDSELIWKILHLGKVNSVQEACAKCFAVHTPYQNLKSWKQHEKQKIKHQNARFSVEKLKYKSLMFFVSVFHVICKISNFNMWTAMYLTQASCTELTWNYPTL